MAETAEATVVFGVLNETSEHESRVALTPDIVTRLRKSSRRQLIIAARTNVGADATVNTSISHGKELLAFHQEAHLGALTQFLG